MTEQERKNKEKEKRNREISIGISSALLVALFTVMNEVIGIPFDKNTPKIINYGFIVISIMFPFLAIDIYTLFLYKPDTRSTRKERNALTFRIIAWFFSIIGLFLIFGGKTVLVNEESNSIKLIYFLAIGGFFAFFHFRQSR